MLIVTGARFKLFLVWPSLHAFDDLLLIAQQVFHECTAAAIMVRGKTCRIGAGVDEHSGV